MTIKDALDRAKLLHKERRQAAPAGEVTRAEPESVDVMPEPRWQAPESVRRAPINLAPLRTVEISEAACAEHHVLLSDEQLKAMPQAAAAYRLLRGRLQQRIRRHNWSVLGIASAGAGDGKTVTALNMAISIAREKQRPVYLLDLDMRSPSVCQYLGLQEMRSVADYFAGTANPEDVLVQTNVPGLFVAGAPAPVEGASEMLAGPRFGELIEHVRVRSADSIVIIDLPPINVTDEALVIAPRIDAILLVASEGKTERKDLARALGTLSEFTVAGVVLNRSSESHAAKYDRYSA